MAKISVKNVVKKYGENIVIPKLSVEIEKGELFTLLGPSGCGKTTLLRMRAGFNSIEGGDICFDDKKINDVDPSKRNIGMVFQNYAIFPNMTVRANVAFGLKNRKLDKTEITKRTEEFLELMQIKQYADRMPDRLSGGQQQRVALARALVIKPDVLLMDEPLSNLDAKLRLEMRRVIRNTQKNIGITTVYVTHDQEEAMAISDKIAIMKEGVIQQIGTSKFVYQRPSNTFVANFIGRSNMVEAELDNGTIIFKNGYKTGFELLKKEGKKAVICSIRPEEFVICDSKEEGIRGIVKESMYLGLNTHYFVELDWCETVEIIEESSVEDIMEPGKEVALRIKENKVNIFEADGSKNLLLS